MQLSKVKFSSIHVKVSLWLAIGATVLGTLGIAPAAFADAPSVVSSPAKPSTTVVNQSQSITESEVLAAQKAWGEALVAIATTYDNQGIDAAKALAGKIIDQAYGYQFGVVLFKPTLTTAPQTFRTTREGALAYFVGGNPNFPNDRGFALNGWRKVDIENAGIFITGNTATTMGNVIITDKNGKVTVVDKTWQFLKDDNGNLRIILHHSSLPYQPGNF